MDKNTYFNIFVELVFMVENKFTKCANVQTQVEEDLVVEKSKIKQVSDDLNAVFEDLM